MDPYLSLMLLVGFLAFYTMCTRAVGRRLAEPGITLALALVPIWTIVGGILVVWTKRFTSSEPATSLERRIFSIELNSDYALTLTAYVVFMLLLLGLVVLLRPSDRMRAAEQRTAMEALADAFPFVPALATVAAGQAVQIVIVRTTESALGTSSLYAEHAPGTQRLLSYTNLATTYLLFALIALLMARPRATDRTRSGYAPWMIALSLAAVQFWLDAILGERGLILIGVLAVVVARSKYGAPSREGRRRFARAGQFVLIIVAVLGVLTIGIVRGGTQPGESLSDRAVSALSDPQQYAQTITGSAEWYAAHMSLYGVLHYDIPIGTIPIVDSAYQSYADAIAAPLDQGFTIHPVAAWWLSVGPIAPLAAALELWLLLALFLWVSRRSVTPRSASFVFTATIYAAGIVVRGLRTGPDGVRGIVIELLLIPGLLLLPFFSRAARRLSASSTHWGPHPGSPIASQPLPKPRLVAAGRPTRFHRFADSSEEGGRHYR